MINISLMYKAIFSILPAVILSLGYSAQALAAIDGGLVEIKQLPNEAEIDTEGHLLLEKTGTYAQPEATIKRGSYKNNWELDVGRESGSSTQSAAVSNSKSQTTQSQNKNSSSSGQRIAAAISTTAIVNQSASKPVVEGAPDRVNEPNSSDGFSENSISPFNTMTASGLGLLPQVLGDPEAEQSYRNAKALPVERELTEAEKLIAGGKNFWNASKEQRQEIAESGFTRSFKPARDDGEKDYFVVMNEELMSQVENQEASLPGDSIGATSEAEMVPPSQQDIAELPVSEAGGNVDPSAMASVSDTIQSGVGQEVSEQENSDQPSDSVSEKVNSSDAVSTVAVVPPVAPAVVSAAETQKGTFKLPMPKARRAELAAKEKAEAEAKAAEQARIARAAKAEEQSRAKAEVAIVQPKSSGATKKAAVRLAEADAGVAPATESGKAKAVSKTTNLAKFRAEGASRLERDFDTTVPEVTLASGVATVYKPYALPVPEGNGAPDQARVVFDISYESEGEGEQAETLYSGGSFSGGEKSSFKGVKAVAEVKTSSKHGDLEHQARLQWDLLNQGWRELSKLEKQRMVDSRMQGLESLQVLHDEEKAKFDTRIKAARSEVLYRSSRLREPIVNNVVLRYQKQLDQGLVTRRELADASLMLKQIRQQMSMHEAELAYLGFDGVAADERRLLNQIELTRMKAHGELLDMMDNSAIPLQQVILQQQMAELETDYWDDATLRVYVEQRKDQTYDNDTIMGVRAELPLSFGSHSGGGSQQRYRAESASRAFRQQVDSDLKLLWQQYRQAVLDIHSTQQTLFVNQKLRDDIEKISKSRVSSIPLLELDAKEKAEVEAVDLTEKILMLRLDAYEALWNMSWRLYVPVEDVLVAGAQQ